MRYNQPIAVHIKEFYCDVCLFRSLYLNYLFACTNSVIDALYV